MKSLVDEVEFKLSQVTQGAGLKKDNLIVAPFTPKEFIMKYGKDPASYEISYTSNLYSSVETIKVPLEVHFAKDITLVPSLTIKKNHKISYEGIGKLKTYKVTFIKHNLIKALNQVDGMNGEKFLSDMSKVYEPEQQQEMIKRLMINGKYASEKARQRS